MPINSNNNRIWRAVPEGEWASITAIPERIQPFRPEPPKTPDEVLEQEVYTNLQLIRSQQHEKMKNAQKSLRQIRIGDIAYELPPEFFDEPAW